MWPCLVILADPFIKIALQLVKGTIHLLAECDTVELIQHGPVEALTDAVSLRALGLGARVIDVLDRKIKLVFMPLGVTAIFAAAVGQYAQQPHVVVFEQRDHAVVEQIGRRDWRLTIVKLGVGDLAVGIDEGLLVDPTNTLQVANIEGVLSAAIARMLALEFAVGFLLGLGLFQRNDLRLG